MFNSRAFFFLNDRICSVPALTFALIFCLKIFYNKTLQETINSTNNYQQKTLHAILIQKKSKEHNAHLDLLET